MRIEPRRYASGLTVLLAAGLVGLAVPATAASGAVVVPARRLPPATARPMPRRSTPVQHRKVAGHSPARPPVPSPSVASTAAGDPGASPPALPIEVATVDVALEDNRFVPAVLTVQRGTQVVMTNGGSAVHDARVSGAFTSPYLSPGESFTYRFTRPGRYSLVCSLHRLEGMTATLVVQ